MDAYYENKCEKERIFLLPFASFFWRTAESRLVDYALSYVSRGRDKCLAVLNEELY